MLVRAVLIWLAILAESTLVFLLRPDFVENSTFMQGIFYASMMFAFCCFISLVIDAEFENKIT